MSKTSHKKVNPSISNVKPSDKHVSSLLRRIQPSDKSQQFIIGQWQRLRIKHPEITHFISATSYMLAPEDPEVREAISTSMLALYILIDETSLQNDIEDTYKDSLKQLFPEISA